MAVPHMLHSASQLNADLIEAISSGQNVNIGTDLAHEVGRSCTAARQALASGAPVYGVSTGMGALSGVALSPPEQRAHQRNLLLGRATGGRPPPPGGGGPAGVGGRARGLPVGGGGGGGA